MGPMFGSTPHPPPQPLTFWVMAENSPLVFWLLLCPATVHRYFDSRNYGDAIFTHWYSPGPPCKSGNSGILGIVLRNVFAVRQNHFHGLGNYREVIFTHLYSPGPPLHIREFGNSGNCPAKRLCCKAKSLPWAWELLGSDISTRQTCVPVCNNANVVGPC